MAQNLQWVNDGVVTCPFKSLQKIRSLLYLDTSKRSKHLLTTVPQHITQKVSRKYRLNFNLRVCPLLSNGREHKLVLGKRRIYSPTSKIPKLSSLGMQITMPRELNTVQFPVKPPLHGPNTFYELT